MFAFMFWLAGTALLLVALKQVIRVPSKHRTQGRQDHVAG